jgi:hypothetical protein
LKRKEQNQARREFTELQAAFDELAPLVTRVLLRGTFDSGRRKSLKIKDDPGPPAYADETGEDAISTPYADAVEGYVKAMASHIHEALNNAKSVLEIAPADVAERALQTVPPCMACGDPCHGGVRSGFDDKCRKRYERAGHPDRAEFIAMVKRERKAASHPESVT